MRTTKMLFVSLILLYLFVSISGQFDTNFFQEIDSKSGFKMDIGERSPVLQLLKPLANILPTYNLHNENFPRACFSDIIQIYREISNGSLDALAFLDAQFKPGSGIMEGNGAWPGSYSQCVSINMNVSSTENKNVISGKYFSLRVKFNSFTTKPRLLLGICLPHTCSRNDTENLSSLFITLNALKNISVVSVHDASETATMTVGAISAIAFLSVLFILVVTGTFLDIYGATYVENKKQVQADTNNIEEAGSVEAEENSPLLKSVSKTKFEVLRVLMAFSVVKNTNSLLDNPINRRRFACFHGLWTLTIFWVILWHTYGMSFIGAKNRYYAYSVFYKRLAFQPIINGSLSIDTLFFLNGMHLALEGLVEIKMQGRIKWLHYFPSRIWRHVPLYAFIMFVFTTLMPHMVQGPFSWMLTDDGTHGEITKCTNYWWSNLLFINNIYPDKGDYGTSCMAWTSYIALDIQFYLVLGSTFLILLQKVRVVSIIYSVVLIFACVLIRGGLAAYFEMTVFEWPTNHLDSPWIQDRQNALNKYPFTRWSPYVVGLLTGLFLFETRLKVKLKRLVSFLGWACCTVSVLLVVYGTYGNIPSQQTPPSICAHLYVALASTVWSLCLAWIVVACMTGKGGVVNTILSWPVWNPLNRFTFSAFLIHPIVLIAFLSNLASLFDYNDFFVLCLFLGVLIVTYCLAFIVILTVELPFLHLWVIVQKTIFTKQNT